MYIQYKPAKKSPKPEKGRKLNTNLGEFGEGDVAGPFITDSDKAEAKRLVDNGDFVAVDPSGTKPAKTEQPPAKTEQP